MRRVIQMANVKEPERYPNSPNPMAYRTICIIFSSIRATCPIGKDAQGCLEKYEISFVELGYSTASYKNLRTCLCGR
jgi:hypothetical protein